MNPAVENLCEALAPWVARHSAVIRINTTSGGVDVASASCVQIGDRFFLATARHNVADVPSKERLAVLPAEGRFSPEDFLSVQTIGYGVAKDPDVAWIEVNRNAALSTGLNGIGLSTLGPGALLQSGHLYLAAGVQASTAQIKQGSTGASVVDLRFRCCVSEPYDARDRESFKLKYAGKVVRSDGSESEHDAPHGMSGGGAWSVTYEQQSGVWVPHRCRLIGIVTNWKQGGYLRCVGIEEWLLLLRQSDPHMDGVIREFAESMMATGIEAAQQTPAAGG